MIFYSFINCFHLSVLSRLVSLPSSPPSLPRLAVPSHTKPRLAAPRPATPRLTSKFIPPSLPRPAIPRHARPSAAAPHPALPSIASPHPAKVHSASLPHCGVATHSRVIVAPVVCFSHNPRLKSDRNHISLPLPTRTLRSLDDCPVRLCNRM